MPASLAEFGIPASFGMLASVATTPLSGATTPESGIVTEASSIPPFDPTTRFSRTMLLDGFASAVTEPTDALSV